MDTLSPHAQDDNIFFKRCTGPCGRLLPATREFFHLKLGSLRAKCKVCLNAEHKEYAKKNEERLKAYWQNNKDHFHERAKDHRDANKEHYKAYRESNKARRAQNMREWKQNNADHLQAYNEANKEHIQQVTKTYKQTHKGHYREQKLIARYGITQSDYDAMLETQMGVCAICGNLPKEGQLLHVDHCHKTGRVRELVCYRCNSILGYADDNSEVLRNAIAYLERNSQ